MAYIITEPCIGNKDTACTKVCPVDCIHTTEEENQYFIDPSVCINCDYCFRACPVNAIFHELDVPPKWRNYITKNKDFFKNEV